MRPLFRLEKVKIKDDCYSAVDAPYAQTGYLHIFDATEDDPQPKGIDTIEEVEIGKQLLVLKGVNYLRTSKIVDIVAKTDTQAQIETQTSIYLLEEVSNV